MTSAEGAEVSDSTDRLGVLPIVAMKFSDTAERACIEWFLSRLSAKDFEGGAELEVTPLDPEERVFGLNASDRIFLSTANILQFKLLKGDGLLHAIEEEDLPQLSVAQRQQMIEYRVDCLQPDDRQPLPGHQDLQPDPQKPLISSMVKFGIVAQLFPLHSPEELKKLNEFWITSTTPYLRADAVDQIRSYFGDEVAIYFAFVRQLIVFLLPLAILPFLDCLWPSQIVSRQAAMAAFNMVWLTIFIEYWKRTASRFAFRWGTINRTMLEQARPAYFGRLRVNEVTGRLERHYPKWKRRVRYWFVSVPVMALSLGVTFWVMIGYLWLEHVTQAYTAKHPAWYNLLLAALPGIGYSILLIVMNSGFRKLALLLNHFENHRLQSAFDNHYVVKLITFYSINGFLCLFYTAFYLRDLNALKDTLATLLITSQVVNQVMESLIPFVTYHVTKKLQQKSDDETEAKTLLSRIEKEGMQPTVEGTIDEYIELYLQFGYVFLFSSLLPWAAVCALINNLVELKSDAFKLCRLHQRPFAKVASGIGAWRMGFEFLGYLAVVTNCGLLYLSPEVQEGAVKQSGALAVFACFVVFEHVLFCAKVCLAMFIKDRPSDVRLSLAKQEYRAEMAWREELRAKTKKDQ